MRRSCFILCLVVPVVVATAPLVGAVQLPLAPASASGQTVTPAFEGWYENADGTYSLSFGYFNRNSEEVLEIPIGPNNFMEPGGADRGQPTRFEPRRHWGIFAVRVPADFGDKRIVWTLKIRGQTFSIPGSLKRAWKIDAVRGEAGSGNTPPVLKFDPDGPEGSGPLGITGPELTARLGQPVTLRVWARDDGRSSGSVARVGKEGVPITLTWFKHRGPGEATFSQPTAGVPTAGGKMTTTVTFNEPGDYVLRVRANDASGVANAGHAQCCWTNGFVEVNVKRE
ncbi:MAG: hypothetical protein ACE5HT_09155 [Gemmatimonadales bacterium]